MEKFIFNIKRIFHGIIYFYNDNIKYSFKFKKHLKLKSLLSLLKHVRDIKYVVFKNKTLIEQSTTNYLNDVLLISNNKILQSYALVKLVGKQTKVKDVILDNVKGQQLRQSSFTHAINLESFKILNDIPIDIGNYSFSCCKNLKYINIPTMTAHIGDYCFEKCISLEHIILPTGIDKLNRGTFAKCTSLQSIYIPRNVKMIDYNCFEYCVSLKYVYVPKDTIIKENAFVLSSPKIIRY